MSKRRLRKGAHVVFDIHLHMVFIPKFRKQVFTVDMLETMREVFSRVLGANKCILEEFSGESDHVHLLVDLHPDNNISDLMASLKSASSRILRQKYSSELKEFYWGDKVKLWHDSKGVFSCGGAPLDLVKEYVKTQSGGRIP